MATLTAALTALSATLATADPVSVRFRRGTESVIVAGGNGKDLRWPYNGAGDPPIGKRFWLPRPLVLGGATIKPREGDILEGIAPAVLAGRVYELVPFGLEPPCASSMGDATWRLNALDTTDAPRRDTVCDLEIPDPLAARGPSGTKDRTAFVTDVLDVAVTVEPQEGSLQQIGSKLQQVRIFKVTMAARNVPGSARFRVKSGWLEEQRLADAAAGKVVPDAVWLNVEAVSRSSAYGLETVCICRCVGG